VFNFYMTNKIKVLNISNGISSSSLNRNVKKDGEQKELKCTANHPIVRCEV